MPNTIRLTVEDPDAVLDTGAYGAGALMRLQTSSTEGGIYADVSGTGSDPTTAVVTGIRSYSAFDPNGTSTSWYRSRFENVGASRVSDWTDVFQVAPLGSGLICDLADVKQELGNTAPDPAGDESILEKIRQVGDEIQDMTGRWFVRRPASGDDTFLLSPRRTSKRLYVPKGIASLTTLEVATTPQPGSAGTYTTVPAAEWYLDPEAELDYGWPSTWLTILESSAYTFTAGGNTVRLTGALGWATVPNNIQAIAVRGVTGSTMAKGSGVGGVAVAGPNGSTTILRNISPADYEVLERYRVREID